MVIPSLLLGLGWGVAFLAVGQRWPMAKRWFWAGGLLVAALIYLGFAIVAQAPFPWLLAECFGLLIYGSCAILGLQYGTGWLVAGWLLHPLWDLGLHVWQAGAEFTPSWYAWTCLSFDLLVGLTILVWALSLRALN